MITNGIHRRRKRLLTIGHSYCVALNRCLANEFARLAADSWEVTVIAPQKFPGDLGQSILTERQADEICELEGMPAHFVNQVHVFLYSWRLRELLREPWDLVHCWEEPYILAGAQVAFWTPKQTPLVYWIYQNIPKKYPPPFAQIERLAVESCSGWIAAGRTVAEAGLVRGYGIRPYRQIGPGVDLSLFSPDRAKRDSVLTRLGWQSLGAPVVGYLGRFVPEKGLSLMMEALDQVKTPWRALFVGAGPMEGALENWAARFGDRVKIMKGMAHSQVPALLNAMDILCVPSQTTRQWREQFGRVIVEGFASGVPVVGSDSGEIPEVIGDAGRIVGQRDVNGWVDAIGELVDNSALRADLLARGLDRARNTYAWPVIARRHLDFFEELTTQS
jgi:glycosyltransferase involved in cell wall biosynthesis